MENPDLPQNAEQIRELIPPDDRRAYMVSIMAQRDKMMASTTKELVMGAEIGHAATLVLATTVGRAERAALEAALGHWPEADGWARHHAAVGDAPFRLWASREAGEHYVTEVYEFPVVRRAVVLGKENRTLMDRERAVLLDPAVPFVLSAGSVGIPMTDIVSFAYREGGFVEKEKEVEG